MSRQKIFVSYSHRDRAWLERLLEHLGALERWQLIHAWTDGRIEAGASWEDEIDRALAEARAAVLLVSPAFLASHYIWDVEMKRIDAHRKEGMQVYPLVVRPCAWRLEELLRDLQARPTDGRPLALGSEAQIDVDLSDFAFELAHLLGRATGALVAKERELTAEFRSAAGGTPRAQSTTAASEAASSGRVLAGVLGPTPQSWSGSYHPTGKELTLTIDAWSADGRFWGTLAYADTGTVNHVNGRLVDHDGDADATLTFRELGSAAREPYGNVDLDGEYRMDVRGTEMSGSWNRPNGIPVGDLHLELVA